MPYLGKKPIDHTDVTQSQSMAVTDDLTINGDTSLVDLAMTGGITFDSRANALDDYEEGTWIPTIGTGTANFGSATYTKIGSLVHVTFSVGSFSDRTSSNDIIIGGLPFSCVSGAFATSTVLGRYFNTPTGGDAIVTFQAGGATTLQFYTMNQSSNYGDVAHNNLSSTSSFFYVSHTYRT